MYEESTRSRVPLSRLASNKRRASLELPSNGGQLQSTHQTAYTSARRQTRRGGHTDCICRSSSRLPSVLLSYTYYTNKHSHIFKTSPLVSS